MALSEAQKRSNKKWNDKHKDKSKIYVARSTTKRFIKDFANEKDLKDLEKLIAEKRKQLKQEQIN